MRLREGEIKILNALKTPKTFKEIINETNLSRSILSFYLKSLYKNNLIDRDFISKKYFLKPLSSFVLFVNEVKDFLIESQKIYSAFNGFILFSENNFINKKFEEEIKKDKKFRESLIYINEILNSIIKSFIQNQFSNKEKEIIKKYELFLKEILKEEINEEDKKFISEIFQNKVLKDFEEALTDLGLGIFFLNFGIEEGLRELEKALNKEQKKKFKTHLAFLKNSKNIRIYKKYLEQKEPKTILLNAFGFGEYQQKIKELFSLIKKEEAKPIIG